MRQARMAMPTPALPLQEGQKPRESDSKQRIPAVRMTRAQAGEAVAPEKTKAGPKTQPKPQEKAPAAEDLKMRPNDAAWISRTADGSQGRIKNQKISEGGNAAPREKTASAKKDVARPGTAETASSEREAETRGGEKVRSVRTEDERAPVQSGRSRRERTDRFSKKAGSDTLGHDAYDPDSVTVLLSGEAAPAERGIGRLVGEDINEILYEDNLIGRGGRSTLLLPEFHNGRRHGISREHARIFLDSGGTLMIEDQGSSNGTFLGSLRLKPGCAYPLEDGDIITAGNLPLRVRRDNV